MKPELEWDEERLTAYVLGEVEEKEKGAIEAAIRNSEVLKNQVEGIRRTAATLAEELAREPVASLYQYQRRRIEAELLGKERRLVWTKLSFAGSLAAAASLIVFFLLSPASDPGVQQTADLTLAEELPRPANAPATPSKDVASKKETPEPKKASPQSAGLAGTVTDATGATIPGAQVTVSQPSGNVETMVTDQRGRFRLDKVAPGPARVEVTLPGFQPFSAAVQVPQESEARLHARLQAGQVSRALMVTGMAEPVTGVAGGGVPAHTFLPRSSDLPSDFPSARQERFNTEAYDRIEDNPFIRVSADPLSTFSIDVDTASYSNIRRFLEQTMLPPRDAVRIEEMINYFSYDYEASTGDHPFAVRVEVAQAPWKREHRLARIGLKGREIDAGRRPPSNLVFLIDVSGSMRPPNKLPLLKKAMRLLVEQLNENDRVAIVVYAGASGLVLPSTPCDQREKILAALESLQAEGSTNGAAGIQLAYQTAREPFIPGGTNRVILATDGDFNVGITNQGDLTRLIEEQAKSGIFLTVLGFGMGNYKDSTLEKLADRGNGNYAYIDSLHEARKVLVEQMGGSLVTIAKDVKIQVEFNPAEVSAYRLIGYENRILRHQDFHDDRKDAGEIGAGLTVTALYEVVPVGIPIDVPGVDPLKYQKPVTAAPGAHAGEMLTLKLRYKRPDEETSRLLALPVTDTGKGFEEASTDFRFAAAVASLGLILRDSPYRGNSSFDAVLEMARGALGADQNGYRKEFLRLVKKAKAVHLLRSSDEIP